MKVVAGDVQVPSFSKRGSMVLTRKSIFMMFPLPVTAGLGHGHRAIGGVAVAGLQPLCTICFTF